jgi:CDGSH-type Zn-finger protein
MADAVSIELRKNGPLRIVGEIKIVDPDGNPVATDGPMVALCRCGGSSNKPFCDGTHRNNGFQS